MGPASGRPGKAGNVEVQVAEKLSRLVVSMWLTYDAAAEQLGLTQGQVAARARRGRWPTRRRSDTGDIEIEVPGDLLIPNASWAIVEPDEELRQRVADAVGRVDRTEAAKAREKTTADEREIAKSRAAAPKRAWWRLGR